MGFSWSIVAILAALLPSVIAAGNDTSLEDQDKPIGNTIPQCAVRCETNFVTTAY